MNCIDSELLSAYADRQVSPAELKAADAHLSGCGKCRAKLDVLLALKTEVKAQPVPLMPQDLKRSLRALGEDASPENWPAAGFFQPALGLAALSLAVWVVRLDQQQPAPARVILAQRVAEAHLSAASFPLSYEPGGLDFDGAEDDGDE